MLAGALGSYLSICFELLTTPLTFGQPDTFRV